MESINTSKHRRNLHHTTLRISLLFVGLVSSNTARLYSLQKNKTFTAFRAAGTILPMEEPFTPSPITLEHETTIDVALTAEPFYTRSFNKDSIGTLLMFRSKKKLSIGRETDIDHRHVKFNEESAENLTGSIKLSPWVQSLGIRFDYFLYFHKGLPNTSFQLIVPVTHVSHHPKFKISKATASSEDNKTIADYFRGSPMVQMQELDLDENPGSIRNLQDPLRFGKISSSHSKTGVSDLHLLFGYDSVKGDNSTIRLLAILLVPTTRGSRSEWLFEPRLGTGGHWGLGFGVHGKHVLAHDHRHHPRALESKKSDDPQQWIFSYNLRYHYLFKDHEVRTLGLKNHRGKTLRWGQYMLLGVNDRPLMVPAANVLTQNVHVSPKSQFEGTVLLSYHGSCLHLDFGYDLWAKQREDVSKKDHWPENTYGFVGSDYADFLEDALPNPEEGSFDFSHTNLTNTISMVNPSANRRSRQGFISSSQLTTSVAESSSALTSMVFVSGGGEWHNENKTILFMIRVGLGYEFSHRNTALRQVHTWLQGRIEF